MDETKRGDNHTLFLMEEACRRGYEVYHYHPETLSLTNAGLRGDMARVHVDQSKNPHYTLEQREIMPLEGFDVVLFRQDPPVDMGYITNTYLLERLKQSGVTLINDPFWVRNMADKLSIFDFPDYLPPTLVSRNMEEIEAFFAMHKDVVIKPLYGFHGHGITRAQSVEGIATQLAKTDEPLMFQPFLPEIKEGNKRIVFFYGEIAGTLCTPVPDPDKEFRIYRDSVDVAYELTPHERDMCEQIGAVLKERDLAFVGIDLIGSYLTEINVGSVGSIFRMDDVYSDNFSAKLWDIVADKRSR